MTQHIRKSYFDLPEDTEGNIRAKAEEFKKQISPYFEAVEIFGDTLCSPEIIAIGEDDVVEAKEFYHRMKTEGTAHILEQTWGLSLTRDVLQIGLPNQLAKAAAAPSSDHEPQRLIITSLQKAAVIDIGIKLQDFLKSDEPLTVEISDKLGSARSLYDKFADSRMGEYLIDRWSPAVMQLVIFHDLVSARQILKEDAAPEVRGSHLTLVKS